MKKNKHLYIILCFVLGSMFLMVSCSQANKINIDEQKKTSSLSEKLLLGMWQYGDRSVGAGYNHLYIFNEDGTYKFQHSQFDGGNRVIDHSGDWIIDGNKVYFTVKKKTVLEGGEYSDASGSVSSAKEIIGGKYKEVYLEPFEKLQYSISDYNENKGTIKINGDEYWSLNLRYYEANDMENDEEEMLNELLQNGYKVIDGQSFVIELNNSGKIRFVSTYKIDDGKCHLYFYLVDQEGIIKYSFPEFYGNNWEFYELSAVAFKDINKDGLKDIVIVSECILGHGEHAAEPFKVAGVYFQSEDDFISIPDIDILINASKNNDNIDEVTKFLSKQNIIITE